VTYQITILHSQSATSDGQTGRVYNSSPPSNWWNQFGSWCRRRDDHTHARRPGWSIQLSLSHGRQCVAWGAGRLVGSAAVQLVRPRLMIAVTVVVGPEPSIEQLRRRRWVVCEADRHAALPPGLPSPNWDEFFKAALLNRSLAKRFALTRALSFFWNRSKSSLLAALVT